MKEKVHIYRQLKIILTALGKSYLFKFSKFNLFKFLIKQNLGIDCPAYQHSNFRIKGVIIYRLKFN